MTARAGAPSDIALNWDAIDWPSVEKSVARLQARIVKAVKVGRWNRVKALQRLLTHSAHAKLLAVRRVTGNDGRKTPGVDGELWDTSQSKEEGFRSLQNRGYRPQPLRRVYIPKSNGKLRPLGIPTMKDRAMQALHLQALDPISETKADTVSYGFRRERSCADAMQRCFITFTKRNPAWILEGDIKGCFDNISHDWLIDNVPMNKLILRRWLQSGFLERQIVRPTISGTPQGGIISPVLANLALEGLEQRIRNMFPRRGKGSEKGREAQVHLIRYADDFIISGNSKEILAKKVKPLVEDFLKERGLELSQEKTRITHISEGFDFLGQNVRRYPNGVLLVKPSATSVKSIRARVKRLVENHQTVPAHELIRRLNPVVRGWANYHSHVVSKRIFQKLDSYIFWTLWRWAKRRHQRKGKRWIKRRYFERVKTRNWCFYADRPREKGGSSRSHLFYASSIRIRRHILVKSELNPYDPAWVEYRSYRKGRKSRPTAFTPWAFEEA